MAVPTVRRRRLGTELRRLREEAALTLEDVEEHTGISSSKVSRIESATRGVRPADVDQLTEVYGAPQSLRAFLAGIARDGTDRRGWWQTYDLPAVYADLISLETDATSVRTFEPLLIPGLLQTAAYARAAIQAHNPMATAEEVAALVDVRSARQAVLTKPEPLKVRAIIHEAAFLASIPGQGVLRDQVQRLLDVAEHPNVTIQVLPVNSSLHPGTTGAFTILGFGQPGLDVVLLEQLESSLYIEESHAVERYVDAFERLTASALPFEESLTLIARRKEALQ